MDIDFKLYLITDRKQTRIALADAVRLALDGGVRAIQLREKDLPIRDLLGVAKDIRTVTKEFGAKLFINDRADIAMTVEADGVHLGRQSMPPEAVRKIVGAKMLIGVSTHNIEEARAAESGGADFITFGPVFATPSKARYGAPVGTAALADIKKQVRLPVFALGGIKTENIKEVLKAGADGIAMISTIFAAENIRKAAEQIIASF